jgi:hypothetical protein
MDVHRRRNALKNVEMLPMNKAERAAIERGLSGRESLAQEDSSLVHELQAKTRASPSIELMRRLCSRA